MNGRRFALAVLVGGGVVFSLAGCFKKTIKVDRAEETARVEDTVSARTPDNKPGLDRPAVADAATEPAAGAIDSAPLPEGAGPVESLESPAPGQEGMPGISGTSGQVAVVEGSRTDVGLLPIYYDFDQSVVREDQVERMAANALFLKDKPEIMVRIEGNCDDRGTNEYNMALGERRAMAAKNYLLNLGIAENRLGILSYGEERLLNPGIDEVARAENRRGDFVIVR